MRKITILLMSILAINFSCSQKSAEQENTEEEVVKEEEAVVEVAPEGRVFFVSPAEGDTVAATFTVVMGVEGMEVEPAGAVNAGKGHHHLIIDAGFIPKGETIPADSTHIHYGKGQTEVELTLSPGTHTLTMQFADGVHSSYGENWSSTISVVVNE